MKLDERLPPLHHRTLRPVLNGKLSMRASTNLWPAESSGSGVVRAEGAMLSLGSTVATRESYTRMRRRASFCNLPTIEGSAPDSDGSVLWSCARRIRTRAGLETSKRTPPLRCHTDSRLIFSPEGIRTLLLRASVAQLYLKPLPPDSKGR